MAFKLPDTDPSVLFGDTFQFKSASEIGAELPWAPSAARADISQALATRDVGDLTAAQDAIFDTAAEQMDSVEDFRVETSEDVEALFGETLDITFVKDLSTTDGRALDGAATADGRILLDAGLDGAALREVLREEIAEAAYYEAFGEASAGDFGAAATSAPGEARIVAPFGNGFEPDTMAENDTVEVEMGDGSVVEAQAAFPTGFSSGVGLANNYALDVMNAAENQLGLEFSNPRNVTVTAQPPGRASSEDALGNDIFGDLSDLGNTITGPNGQDYFFSASIKSDVTGEVVDLRNEELTPVPGLSDTWRPGQGDITKVYTVDQGQSVSYTDSYETSIGFEQSYTLGGDILGAESQTTFSSEFSAGFSETNSWTSNFQDQTRYSLTGGEDYTNANTVSLGLHERSGDAVVEQDYVLHAFVGPDNGAGKYALEVDVTSTDLVENYIDGLVWTDFAIA